MPDYLPTILITIAGFAVLTFILLAPVYFFLKREERASKKWTKEALARRSKKEDAARNGQETNEQQSVE